MSSCERRHEHIIQEKDRILNFGNDGTVLVTDKCVIVIRDSSYQLISSGNVYRTIATKVYMFHTNPVINNVTLLNKDTVRVLSKEQVEALQKRIKKE